MGGFRWHQLLSHHKDNGIERFYPIGTPGKPWTADEDKQWKAQTKFQRSYKEEVIDKLETILQEAKDKGQDFFEIKQYGSLSHDPSRYPLISVQSKDFDTSKPCVLVTGGVHGYETSGVQGAIAFVRTEAAKYANNFNIVVYPCVSPWSYEHIQRWNADLMDPNRSFHLNDEFKQTEESKALIAHIRKIEQEAGSGVVWKCHLDLHETTDSDATEFMPAKHAKAGLPYNGEVTPNGFFLVANAKNPQLAFHKAIINHVKKVTQIATPDKDGNVMDEPLVQEGVVQTAGHDLGVCGGVTGGKYTTTTEVCPNNNDGEKWNQVQVAAIVGALDYILTQQSWSRWLPSWVW